ncbi:YkgJ family cysteine cluster protein [Halosquirtibacter laminarini]|uniref:YkgJ family cysteine cluster protein n=1 Tax=Halosquirtibacter laminarini TaxID=3374600 RepID=A0AC61NDT3_9BACT|nr:YkgJ family cysteine cluster protein [Prolixibacteraceae bacterium]
MNFTGITPQSIVELSKQNSQEIKELFKKLKKKKPKNLDAVIHSLHQEAFELYDCLDCGNCCSSISPIVKEKDIDRLSKHFRIKSSKFIDEYLQVDDENDFVFRNQPCPFLGNDMYCMCYESRPKACREYPHTDRSKMHQILKLTETNRSYCPIVYVIIEELLKMNW